MKNYPKSVFNRIKKVQLEIKRLECYLENPDNMFSNILEKYTFSINEEYRIAVQIYNNTIAQKKYLEKQIQEYIA